MIKSRYYITTAASQVMGKPEFDDVQDQLLGDIIGRYLRQQGKDVRLQVGVNELGTGMQVVSEREGLTPMQYIDREYPAYIDLSARLNINYTDFMRTISRQHQITISQVWARLGSYLYKSPYEGWYAEGEESLVNDKTASQNGGKSPASGKPYERVTEENYFFKLSTFIPRIREAIESGEVQILPEERKNELLALIDEGVSDVSVTRSSKLHSWGIAVPGDTTQTVYTSFSALIGYLSSIGYPEDESNWKSSWPADVQVVGRDTLRFHGILWFGVLMALDLPLPRKVLVRGHVTSGGVRMEKSSGNVIDPVEVIDTYGIDAFRYYVARHVGTLSDGDITWERFETVYNTELANELGNLVHRVASMIVQYQSGVIGEIKHGEHDIQLYRLAMREYNFNEALDRVWSKIHSSNYYLDTVKPWDIADDKSGGQEAIDDTMAVLRNVAGSILQISDLLVPFMPETANRIHAIFSSELITADNTTLFPRIYKYTEDTRIEKGA